jgi:hypothetical protein
MKTVADLPASALRSYNVIWAVGVRAAPPCAVTPGKSRSATQSPSSLRCVSAPGLQEVPIGKSSGPSGESGPTGKSVYHQNRS